MALVKEVESFKTQVIQPSQKLRLNRKMDVFSETKTVRFYGKLVNCLGAIGFVPYAWDKGLKEMKFKEDAKSKYLFGFHFTSLALYEMYLVVRCYQTLTQAETSILVKIQVVYQAFLFLAMNVNHITLMRSWGMHSRLFTELKDISGILLQNGVTPKESKKAQRSFNIMRLITIGCGFGSISRSMGVFRKPNSPALLTSLFDDPKSLGLGVKLGCGLFHLHVNLFMYYMLGFSMSSVFCFMQPVVPMINRLRYHQGNNGHLQRNISELKHIQTLYIRLGVIMENFNSIFSMFVFMSEVCTITGVVVNLFLAVVFGTMRTLVMAGIVTIIGLYLFRNLGLVYEESKECLHGWRMVRNPSWFIKFRAGARPLKVVLGGMYYVDRSLVLTLLSTILIYSANLVLTFRYD